MGEFFRLRGVKLMLNAEEDKWYYEAVPDEADAESWGVYEVENDGADSWLADFKSKRLAQEYIELKISALLTQAAVTEPPVFCECHYRIFCNDKFCGNCGKQVP